MGKDDSEGFGQQGSGFPDFMPPPVQSPLPPPQQGFVPGQYRVETGPGMPQNPYPDHNTFQVFPPQGYSPTPVQTPKRSMGRIFVIILVALVGLGIIIGFAIPDGPDNPVPTFTYTPPPLPTTSTQPTTSSQPTTTAETPPSTYRRERLELTADELAAYGQLKKGDCLTVVPDDLASGPTETVDCSQPHAEQVMGFIDLTEEVPDRIADPIQFEITVAQRCNSLKATMPIPSGFDEGVFASYPDEEQWTRGVRVALCWVPVFDKTWVGSALDGTAEEV